MPVYRAVILGGGSDNPRIVELVNAPTDEEALAHACEAASTFAFELWDALVMLGRYDPSD